MTHSHSLRLLGVMSGVLFSMSAYALNPANVPGPKVPIQKMPAAAVAPQGAGDGALGMALLGAQVSNTAVINFGAGATGALKLSTGTYEVQFNRDVTQCIYTASAFFGQVVTDLEPRSGNPNGVFLIVRNSAFTASDGQFYLNVFCPR